MQVAFFSIAAIYVLSKNIQSKFNFINSLLFVFFCASAFLSKTTFIYMAPGIFWIFISNYKNSHFFKFTILSCILGIISLFLIGYFYKYHTGDYLYIFSRIESNHYTHSESYFDKNWIFLLERLTVGPIKMFINTGMIIPFLLSIPIYFPRNWKQLTDTEKIWPSIAASILIMFWVGSLSFKFYHPMSLLPRMVLLLTPFLAITASISYFKFIHQKTSPWVIILLLTSTTIYCYLAIYPQKSITYLILTLCYILYFLIKQKFQSKTLIIKYLPLIFIFHPLYSALKPKEFDFESEERIFNEKIKYLKGTLITDARPSNSFDIYFNYIPHSNLKIISSANPIVKITSQKIYLLENKGFTNYFKQLNLNQEYEIAIKSPKKLVQKINNVSLYELQ